MNKGKKTVNRLSKAVQKKYSQSVDNYWLRGLIQAIPAVGGTLDTWFFQFAEKEKQKRVEQSLNEYANRLDKLENQIDVKYIEEHIEEYAFLFEKFIKYISQEYRKELRKHFISLMVNFSSKTYSSEQAKDVYFSKLSELTPEHIVMLRLAYEYSFPEDKQDFEKTKMLRGYLIGVMKKRGFDQAMITAILTDLQSKGLLREEYHATYGGGLYTHHVTQLGIKILKLLN